MRCKSALMATAFGVFGVSALATTLWAQGANAPWRGAGTPACYKSDGGSLQCDPAPRVQAVRAGRLFDSNTGQMLTGQVVLLQGDRITAVSQGNSEFVDVRDMRLDKVVEMIRGKKGTRVRLLAIRKRCHLRTPRWLCRTAPVQHAQHNNA